MARLLVVDDDPMMRMTMRSLLEPLEHAVAVAADGRKAPAGFQLTIRDLLLGAVSLLPKPFKLAASPAMVTDRLAAAEHSAALSRPDRDAISNS